MIIDPSAFSLSEGALAAIAKLAGLWLRLNYKQNELRGLLADRKTDADKEDAPITRRSGRQDRASGDRGQGVIPRAELDNLLERRDVAGAARAEALTRQIGEALGKIEEGVTPHTFRHTFASRLAIAGRPSDNSGSRRVEDTRRRTALFSSER